MNYFATKLECEKRVAVYELLRELSIVNKFVLPNVVYGDTIAGVCALKQEVKKIFRSLESTFLNYRICAVLLYLQP